MQFHDTRNDNGDHRSTCAVIAMDETLCSKAPPVVVSKLFHHLPPAVLQPFPLNLLTAQKEGVPLTIDIIVCTLCTICRFVQMQNYDKQNFTNELQRFE